MLKKALAVLVFGFACYSAYDYYRFYSGPFYDRPDIGQDDFLLAFDNGMRGIMRGFGDADTTRKYMGTEAANVPQWYLESWADCREVTEEEQAEYAGFFDHGPGSRLEAICELEADGEVFPRGIVFSVPIL